jgi:hypothetical protein
MACGDEKTIVSEVGLWLMVNNIPYQKYDKLSVQLKKVLRNQICEPTHPTTARERADLYKELCMPDGNTRKPFWDYLASN